MAKNVSSFADTMKKMGVTSTPSVSSPAPQSGGSAGSGQGSVGSSSPFEEALKKIGIYTPRDAAEANDLLQRSVDQSSGIADYLNSEEPMTWEERSRYQDSITGSRNQIKKIQEIYGTEGTTGLSDWYDNANRELAAKTSNWKAEQQAQETGGLEELAQETAEKPSLWQRFKNLFRKPEVSTTDWEGRDALIQELNDIDANSGWILSRQIRSRREDQRSCVSWNREIWKQGTVYAVTAMSTACGRFSAGPQKITEPVLKILPGQGSRLLRLWLNVSEAIWILMQVMQPMR